MSDTPATSYIYTTVLAIIVGFLAFKIAKPYLTILHKKFYAWFLDDFAKFYNTKMDDYKRKFFADLHEFEKTHERQPVILELGAGSGANFKFYPDGSEVICVDPNAYFESYLRANLEKYPNVKVTDFVVGCGENMSFVPDNSVDVVVCTLVLCTVVDVDQSLREIRRVLKPGGRLFTLEHVQAKEWSFTYIMQKLMKYLWRPALDGCTLDRPIWKNVESTGFTTVTQRKFDAPLGLAWFHIAPHLSSVAVK